MKNEEHNLQVACVRWFAMQYPKMKDLLIAIPNGGKRHPTVAAKMKAEGAKAGVPDLFLATPELAPILPSSHYQIEYSGLWVEMKTPKGVLRPNQKEYFKRLSDQGYAVAVCRSFESFQNTVFNYLNGEHTNDPKLTQ